MIGTVGGFEDVRQDSRRAAGKRANKEFPPIESPCWVLDMVEPLSDGVQSGAHSQARDAVLLPIHTVRGWAIQTPATIHSHIADKFSVAKIGDNRCPVSLLTPHSRSAKISP